LARFRKAKPSGDDELKDWHAIGAWLASPDRQDWRELLGIFSKLLDPAKNDPVGEAAAFLKKDDFEIQIKAVNLSIPNNLPQGPLTPGDALLIHFQPHENAANRITLTYRINKSASVDGTREKSYRFVLDKGDGRFTFKPGDEFSAELHLVKGAKVWQFSWANSRTASYAFDALTREPFIHAVGPLDRSTLADGVRLAIDGTFPSVLELLPKVR
jgi:hypothetical protein